MTCTVINCKRLAAGTAALAGRRHDVCERCGRYVYGNFTAYPSAPLFELEGI